MTAPRPKDGPHEWRLPLEDARYLRNLLRREGVATKLTRHRDGTATVRELPDPPKDPR